jgi:hypothetical protein
LEISFKICGLLPWFFVDWCYNLSSFRKFHLTSNFTLISGIFNPLFRGLSYCLRCRALRNASQSTTRSPVLLCKLLTLATPA